MYNSYKKILTGALLIFFDLNIGIDILPDFIGYLLMISALKELFEKTDRVDFKKAYFILYPLVPLSLYSLVISFGYENLTEMNQIVTTVSITLLALSMYYFYTATLPFIRDIDLYNKVKLFKNVYVYSNLSFAFILTFGNYGALSGYTTVVFIFVVISMIVTIGWLFNLRNLRNYFEMRFSKLI